MGRLGVSLVRARPPRAARAGARRAGVDAVRGGARRVNTRIILTRALLPRHDAGRPRPAALGDPLDRRLRDGRPVGLGDACADAGRPGALRSSSDMTTILGISAFYHDSAACLVRDGEIVAAAQEERFTRKKHDARVSRATPSPTACAEARHRRRRTSTTSASTTSRSSSSSACSRPTSASRRAGSRSFLHGDAGVAAARSSSPRDADPARARTAIEGEILLHRAPRVARRERVLPVAVRRGRDPHHGRRRRVGDVVATASAAATDLELLAELHFPHSLGLLYSAFTYYTGFKVNSGEYKLMGLAPYGEPRYVDRILDELRRAASDDGSFQLEHGATSTTCHGLTMTNGALRRALRRPAAQARVAAHAARDGPRRVGPGGDRGDRAAHGAARAPRDRACENLCLAGGVALNCVGNGRLLREGPFERPLDPAGGRRRRRRARRRARGLAQGARRRRARSAPSGDAHARARTSGRRSRDDEIEACLRRGRRRLRAAADASELLDRTVAQLLADEKVVGWFQGRMEFGPRALGAAASSATRARRRCSR